MRQVLRNQQDIESDLKVINDNESQQNQARHAVSDLKYKILDSIARLKLASEQSEQDQILYLRTIPQIPVLPSSVEEIQEQIVKHKVCDSVLLVDFFPIIILY